MALGVPSSSPAVVIKEIDASTSIRTASTTIGGTVGSFRWGPVGVPMTVATETELVETFAAPNDANSVDFHSAAYYLRYADNLKVVRTTDANAKNAHNADSAAVPTINNSTSWDAQEATLADSDHTFIAKYPGALGNSLKVEVCLADSAEFALWGAKGEFDTHPGTSATATAEGATNDEVHVAVIDVNGEFGEKGEVLETFPFVSLATNSKKTDGSSNYIKDVVNRGSEYVWMSGFGATGTFDADAGTAATNGKNFLPADTSTVVLAFSGGVDPAAANMSGMLTAFDQLEDADTVDVDILFANSLSARSDHATVASDITATAESRKDCVVCVSPARSDVVGVANPATIVTNTIATLAVANMGSSSYRICDNNFLKVYDKYNDKYIMIPAASSTAGIMAATDNNAAPWVSPAGTRRGNYLGITSLAYSPTKAQRDTLYKANINPIANIPGQGILLYGDKTHLSRPSAFDRINVRRLFVALEKSIGEFAKASLFELNDEFTRAEFVNNVEPLLREVKGRRGLTDFKVVCDETNNTASVIDRNEFVATIFIKPARSINYITLNFVATRTGADFEEVVGI